MVREFMTGVRCAFNSGGGAIDKSTLSGANLVVGGPAGGTLTATLVTTIPTANAEVLKRLAEIDQTLLKHDKSLQILWRELKPLLTPPPAPPKRQIGFHEK